MTHSSHAPLGAFILRLSLGVLFLAHAYLKIFIFTPAGTAGYFQSLGLPAILAYATIGLELAAGIALVLGVASRWFSIATIPVLIGSIVFSHGDKGWLFSNEGGGWEFPAFWIAALIVQALLGNGAYALKTPAFQKAERLQTAD